MAQAIKVHSFREGEGDGEGWTGSRNKLTLNNLKTSDSCVSQFRQTIRQNEVGFEIIHRKSFKNIKIKKTIPLHMHEPLQHCCVRGGQFLSSFMKRLSFPSWHPTSCLYLPLVIQSWVYLGFQNNNALQYLRRNCTNQSFKTKLNTPYSILFLNI